MLRNMSIHDKSNLVIICIPIYKNKLNTYEQAAMLQLNKKLGKYPRIFIAPESLMFDYGIYGEDIMVETFPDYYFKSVLNYSALMLNRDFYQRFAKYKYMLLYQTDAFIFQDKLSEFCSLDYDYIGAPVPMVDPIWHFIGGRVGNGGFSLRKISSAIRMLECWNDIVGESPLASVFWQWEDVFWGYCGQQADLDFKVPGVKIAKEFAVQSNVSHTYKRIHNGWRPFGCHGWWQMDYDFWQPVIEAEGFDFSHEKKICKLRYERLNDYLQSRNSLNMHYLWGLYHNGKREAMLALLDRWLEQYPEENKYWQLVMEKIICLWRVVETDKNKEWRLACQLRLSEALIRSLSHGVTYTVCWNLLITMLPYLQKYDYKITKELALKIETSWWRMWVKDSQKNILDTSKKKKKIAVITKVVDEKQFVESFIRHTLTFADVILVDIKLATISVKKILESLEQEGLPLILYDNNFRYEAIKDDIDFTISLTVHEFLVSQNKGGNVRDFLEELSIKFNYTIECARYACYLPYAHLDKFVLLRPLLRKSCSEQWDIFIRGNMSDGKKISSADKLYVIRFTEEYDSQLRNGIMPADSELVDVSPFVTYQKLKY